MPRRVAVTLNIYAHLMPDSLDEAASRIDAYLMRAGAAGRIGQLDH